MLQVAIADWKIRQNAAKNASSTSTATMLETILTAGAKSRVETTLSSMLQPILKS